MRKNITKLVLIAGLFFLLTDSIHAQESPDQGIIDEINRLGELLYLYDQAAWHGTDAILPLMQDDADIQNRVRGYVVQRVRGGG